MAAMNNPTKTAYQSWGEFADRLGLNYIDSDHDDEQCSSTNKSVNHTCMKLPKDDMVLYGHLPVYDDFTLLKCPICNMNVRHQYFFSHVDRRHDPSTLSEKHQETVRQLYTMLPSKTSNSFSSPLVQPPETSTSAKNSMFKSQASNHDHHSSSSNASTTRSSSSRSKSRKKNLLEATVKRILPNAEVVNAKGSHLSGTKLPSPQQPPPSTNYSRSQLTNQNDFHDVYVASLNYPGCDPDRHCGVTIPATGKPCLELLNCTIHSTSHKKSVPGRSRSFKELLRDQGLGDATNSDGTASPVNKRTSSPTVQPKPPSSVYSNSVSKASNKMGKYGPSNCIKVKPNPPVRQQLKSAKNELSNPSSKKHKSNDTNLLAKALAEKAALSNSQGRMEVSMTAPVTTATISYKNSICTPSATNLDSVNCLPHIQIKVENTSSCSFTTTTTWQPPSPSLPQLRSEKRPVRDFKPQLCLMSNGFHNFVTPDDSSSDSEDDVKLDFHKDLPYIHHYPRRSAISTSRLRHVAKGVFTNNRKSDNIRQAFRSKKDLVLVEQKREQCEEKICDKPVMPVSMGSPDIIPVTSQHTYMSSPLITAQPSIPVGYYEVSPQTSSCMVVPVYDPTIPVTNYRTDLTPKYEAPRSRTREKTAQKRRRKNSGVPNGSVTHNFMEQHMIIDPLKNVVTYAMPEALLSAGGIPIHMSPNTEMYATINAPHGVMTVPSTVGFYVNPESMNGQFPQHTIVINDKCSRVLDLSVGASAGQKFLQPEDMRSSGSYMFSPMGSPNMLPTFVGSPSSPIASTNPAASNQLFSTRNGLYQPVPLTEYMSHSRDANISTSPMPFVLSSPDGDLQHSPIQVQPGDNVLQLLESDGSDLQSFTGLPVQGMVDASHGTFQIALPLTLTMQETDSSVLPSPPELSHEELSPSSWQTLFATSSQHQSRTHHNTRIVPKEMPPLMQTVRANGQLYQIPADILRKNGITNKDSFI